MPKDAKRKARTEVQMDRGEAKGRGVVIPPEMVKELKKLPLEERHRRLKRHLAVHGEVVETVDGWTPYGPKGDHA